MSDKKKINRVHLLSHPTRYDILKLLEKAGERGNYAAKIAAELNLDSTLVLYHLTKISPEHLNSRMGIVDSEEPLAARYYTLTDETKKYLEAIESVVKNI